MTWKRIITLIALQLSHPIVILDWYISTLVYETDVRKIIKDNKEIF